MDSKELSPIKKTALSIVDFVRDVVINDCDDETLLKTTSHLSDFVDVGVREKDYLNYDEAIKVLGIGYNRNKLASLARMYNIKCHRFRNMPIGFHKDDIAKLKEIIDRGK